MERRHPVLQVGLVGGLEEQEKEEQEEEEERKEGGGTRGRGGGGLECLVSELVKRGSLGKQKVC